MIIKREAGENKSSGNVDLPKSGLIRATKSRERRNQEKLSHLSKDQPNGVFKSLLKTQQLALSYYFKYRNIYI